MVAIVIVGLIIVGATQSSDNSGEHKVTYDCRGGNISGEETKTYNEKAFVMIEPSKDGYKFEGWYTEPKGGGNKMEEGASISSDITVYANWTPDFNLTFNEIGQLNDADVFEVVGRNGNVPITIFTTSIPLPLEGTTKIVATDGTEFIVIKDKDNNDALRYKVGDKYYYTQFSFTNATNVMYGINTDTGKGYVQFSYDSNVNMGYVLSPFSVQYHANGGTISGTTDTYKIISSLMYADAATVGIVPPAGKVFDKWTTGMDGSGDVVTPGSSVSLSSLGSLSIYINVYAQYMDIV